MDGGHLAWAGFSFADQRITAILREIAVRSGTRADPGAAPRHVAVMAWDPAARPTTRGSWRGGREISFGAQLVLYPAPGGDHSALAVLLEALTDPRFPPVADLARASTSQVRCGPGRFASAGPVPVMWVPAAERVEHFTGRAEELARLDRWAADPQVSLIGVTAWGGAGKTALVTRWVQEAGGAARRPGVRGVFGWSFYADPSVEHWAASLLGWARQDLGVQVSSTGGLAGAVLRLLRAVPLLLVLDGLERVQEGPAGGGFGGCWTARCARCWPAPPVPAAQARTMPHHGTCAPAALMLKARQSRSKAQLRRADAAACVTSRRFGPNAPRPVIASATIPAGSPAGRRIRRCTWPSVQTAARVIRSRTGGRRMAITAMTTARIVSRVPAAPGATPAMLPETMAPMEMIRTKAALDAMPLRVSAQPARAGVAPCDTSRR